MKSVIDKSYDAFLSFLQNTSKEELNRMVDEVNENSVVGEPTVEEYFLETEKQLASLYMESTDLVFDDFVLLEEVNDVIPYNANVSSVNTSIVRYAESKDTISYGYVVCGDRRDLEIKAGSAA